MTNRNAPYTNNFTFFPQRIVDNPHQNYANLQKQQFVHPISPYENNIYSAFSLPPNNFPPSYPLNNHISYETPSNSASKVNFYHNNQLNGPSSNSMSISSYQPHIPTYTINPGSSSLNPNFASNSFN
jgi:hypothetical protein